MRFNPNTVKRHTVRVDSSGEARWVAASDYDALLALYNKEREARRDDREEYRKELRIAYAEGDYNARNEPGTY